MASHLGNPYPQHQAGDAVIVVHFAGRTVSLDAISIEPSRDQLFALAEEPCKSPLLLDFANVDYISSLTLGMLVNLHKKLRAADRRLTFCNLSPHVYDVFAVTRLDTLLDLRAAEPWDEPATDRQAGAPVGVLVVDDDTAVLRVLSAALQRDAFNVWLAGHGHQAIATYRRHRDEIAVVLLDVLMPGMDGPHTLTALRKLNSAVLCCFMTGNRQPYTEEALLQMGADRVFQKPFAFTEVSDTLHQLASRCTPRRQHRWVELPQEGE